MSKDFKEGLEKIWQTCDDHTTFTREVIRLHNDEVDKARGFIPISEEQHSFLLRILMLPVLTVVLTVSCVAFIFSSTLFGHIIHRMGEGFLKKKKGGDDDNNVPEQQTEAK